jgi:hypothetical protein
LGAVSNSGARLTFEKVVARPDGVDLAILKFRVTTPLDRFRKHYPQYASCDNEKLIAWLHDYIEPHTPIEEFKQKVNPPPTNLPFLTLGQTTGKVEGERVVVIGNPTGLTGTRFRTGSYSLFAKTAR